MVDLTGAFAKLDRADEHFKTLEGAIQWWSKQNPDAMAGHSDPQMTEHTFIAHFRVQPDFARWGILFGDCVHNLRSALDHFIWSASEVNGAPPERAEFPIMTDKDLFLAPVKNKTGGQYKISGISAPAVRALIQRYQPWSDPQGAEAQSLLAVHDFDRIDKHRLITPVFLLPTTIKNDVLIEYADEATRATALLPIWDVSEDAVEHNTRVLTVHTPTPPKKVQVKAGFEFRLTVELNGQQGGPLGTLGNLCKYTRGVLEELRDALV